LPTKTGPWGVGFGAVIWMLTPPELGDGTLDGNFYTDPTTGKPDLTRPKPQPHHNTGIPPIDKLQKLFGQAEQTASPLVLDLNGDGVKALGISAGVYFDHDGNGFAQLSGWVSPDDGLLVWDRNGNGQIDDGSELFGAVKGVGG